MALTLYAVPWVALIMVTQRPHSSFDLSRVVPTGENPSDDSQLTGLTSATPAGGRRTPGCGALGLLTGGWPRASRRG